MNDNMRFWDNLRTPPPTALKKIMAGRLRGKSDISPQWRMQAMTETFGPVGIGWKYEIVKLWTDQGPNEVVFAHAHINIYIKADGEWSEPIPGIGGNKLVEKESKGLYANDEGYKMALTDALSVAMKAVGVAADIYLGNMDGSKYSRPQQQYKQPQHQKQYQQPPQHQQPPQLNIQPANGSNFTGDPGDKIGDDPDRKALKKLHASVTNRKYDREGVRAAMGLFVIQKKGEKVKYPFRVDSSKDITLEDMQYWEGFLNSIKEHHELKMMVDADDKKATGWADHFRQLIENKDVMGDQAISKDRHLYTLTGHVVSKIRNNYLEWLKEYSEVEK